MISSLSNIGNGFAELNVQKRIQNRENSEKGIPFEIENIVTWAKFICKVDM